MNAKLPQNRAKELIKVTSKLGFEFLDASALGFILKEMPMLVSFGNSLPHFGVDLETIPEASEHLIVCQREMDQR